MNILQKRHKMFNFTLIMSAHYLVNWKQHETADCLLQCIQSNQLFVTFADSFFLFFSSFLKYSCNNL